MHISAKAPKPFRKSWILGCVHERSELDLRLKLKTSVSNSSNILRVEPLAQRLRLLGSGPKFCKQRLKYGRHNSFSTSKFKMDENKVHVYKPTTLK